MQHYDVIIVGAGLAGGLTAYTLAKAGLKVLVLEAGDDSLNRNDYLKNYYEANPSIRNYPETPYPLSQQAPFPQTFAINDYYVQHGPQDQQFRSTYLRVLGGTTLHWLGTALRFHPNDFKLFTLYNQGRDWPLSYAELEPWYSAAEIELGVAGNNHAQQDIPRSQSYPMPEIAMSYLGSQVKQSLSDTTFEGRPLHVIATPQARNSVNGYQNRPACAGNHSCIPICPIQAKYDALVHIQKAIKNGAIVQSQSVVDSLQVDASGQISQLHYLRWDGSQHAARANVYILAAHGIETPKILLNSRHARFPNGIANHSNQVGRNLMDHPGQLSYAMSKHPVYPMRSPLSTSGIENLMDGAHRKHSASLRMEILDSAWSWPTGSPASLLDQFIEQGYVGETLNQLIRDNVNHQVALNSLVEMLPNPENKITLSDKHDALGIPRPRIQFKIDDYARAGLARARALHDVVFKKMEANTITHLSEDNWHESGHIMGTTIMGNNPRTSVVDKHLRSHDHSNLYIISSSVFPSSSCANPSLTIAALALRLADGLKRMWVR